jgi:mono/diheme cytochrome c family protein
MRTILIFSLICGIGFFASCKKDDNCNTSDVTYTNTVKSILDSNCALSGCHNSGSGNGSLASYDDAVAFAAQGRIVGAIKHQDGFVAMPQTGGKLEDCEINQIEAWISDGAPQ